MAAARGAASPLRNKIRCRMSALHNIGAQPGKIIEFETGQSSAPPSARNTFQPGRPWPGAWPRPRRLGQTIDVDQGGIDLRQQTDRQDDVGHLAQRGAGDALNTTT